MNKIISMTFFNKINYILLLLFIIQHSLFANLSTHPKTNKTSNIPTPIEFDNYDQKLMIGQMVEILEDPEGKLTHLGVLKATGFKKSNEIVPNLGLSKSVFWIRFSIKNNSDAPLALTVLQSIIDEIELYSFNGDVFTIQKSGQKYPFYQRKYENLDFIFDLNNNDKTSYLLKIKSCKQLLLPLQISTLNLALESSYRKETIFAFFTGIILVMVFYNFFIFLSVKDKSYIYYVLYIFSIGLAQTIFPGFAFKYFWPGSSYLAINSLFITSGIAGITAIPFFINFLNTQKYIGRLNYILYTIFALYLLVIITSLFNLYSLSYQLIELSGLLFSLSVLTIALYISIKGSRPAKFFVLAWSIFLLGVAIYALKDIGVLPYNNLTNYTMPFGTAIEVILLSLALADRINLLRKENSKKQEEIIKQLKKNEEFLILWKEAVLNSEKLKREYFRNQVNPHFLFNSLNVLTELLYANQEQAALFVTQLSQVYRYVLEHKDEEVVMLKTELEFIEAFIFLLKIRFDKNLIIQNNIYPDENKMIPPLTLQLLIENAIKHNIVSSEEPLTITIESDRDYVIIKNKIQLKGSIEKSTGIGLKNIEERYKFLSDKKIDVEIYNNTFIVKVPLLEMR